MDSKTAMEQIQKMFESYSKTYMDCITERDINNRKCYKTMLDSQRKCMEELIKIYHRELDKEEDGKEVSEELDGNYFVGSRSRDTDY